MVILMIRLNRLCWVASIAKAAEGNRNSASAILKSGDLWEASEEKTRRKRFRNLGLVASICDGAAQIRPKLTMYSMTHAVPGEMYAAR